MGMIKTIEIDGKEVAFKASAAVPRLYRLRFGRDIYKDIKTLAASTAANDEGNSQIDIEDLEVFENVAYIMAKHADPSVPETPEEWLDGFNTFSIYQVMPQIVELWGMNTATNVDSKKK